MRSRRASPAVCSRPGLHIRYPRIFDSNRRISQNGCLVKKKNSLCRSADACVDMGQGQLDGQAKQPALSGEAVRFESAKVGISSACPERRVSPLALSPMLGSPGPFCPLLCARQLGARPAHPLACPPACLPQHPFKLFHTNVSFSFFSSRSKNYTPHSCLSSP